MISFELHREAEAELYEAAAYYEDRVEGLGIEFLDEVDAAIRWVCEHPLASERAPAVSPELAVRRKLLDRFPFGLPYLQQGERIVFLAVAHLSRAPGYWLERAGDYR